MTGGISALPDPDLLFQQREAAYARTDPTAALLAEHAWLEEAVLALADIAGGDPPVFLDAFGTLAAVLALHIRKEEGQYFPALREAYAGRGRDAAVIDEMVGEHDGIALRRQAVESAPDEPGALERVVRGLTHALAVHFENEEELVLGDGTEVLGDRNGAVVAGFRSLDRGRSSRGRPGSPA